MSLLDMKDSRTGATCFHLAALVGTEHVLRYALDIHVRELREKEDSYIQSLKARLRRIQQVGASEDIAEYKEWMAEEQEKTFIDTELEIEAWHQLILCRRDHTGRTPLHYACAMLRPSYGVIRVKSCVQTMLGHGRANLTRVKELESGRGGGSGAAAGRSTAHPPPPLGGSLTRSLSSVPFKDTMDVTTSRTTFRIRKRRADMVNFEDDRGNSPLHYASAAGDIDAVKALLGAGALSDAVNDNGEWPVDVSKSLLVRQILSDAHGTKAYKLCSTNIPPELVAQSLEDEDFRLLEMMKVMAETGENFDRRTGVKLQTNLHKSAERGFAKTAAFLVKRGANIYCSDSNGKMLYSSCCATWLVGSFFLSFHPIAIRMEWTALHRCTFWSS
jgi:hypothetical protein